MTKTPKANPDVTKVGDRSRTQEKARELSEDELAGVSGGTPSNATIQSDVNPQ